MKTRSSTSVDDVAKTLCFLLMVLFIARGDCGSAFVVLLLYMLLFD